MTTTYAALLRGINVGGRRQVPMAELRALLDGLGYGGVRTLLQSGNAVLTAPGDPAPERLAAELERALADRFGFEVPVMVRGAAELRAIVDANPFPDAPSDPAKHAVTFLSGPVDPGRLDALDPASYAPDVYRPGEREIYAYYPDGLGRSRLGPLLTKARLGAEVTTRNWNTVLKLLAASGGRPGGATR